MADVLPHFVADGTSVRLGPWETVGEAGMWLESVTISLTGTTTPISTSVAARGRRPRAFFEQTGLGPGTTCLWSVTWRASDTRLIGGPLPWPVRYNEESTLEFHLHGGGIGGGSLDLRCRITLTERTSAAIGVAREPGSIVFEDRHRVALVGDLARYPVAVIDFAAAGLDGDRKLRRRYSRRPSHAPRRSLLLLVNARDQRLVQALTRQSGRDSDLLCQQLEEAVTVAMLTRAVEHSSELHEEFEPDSVGATLRDVAARVTGGLDHLVAERRASMSRFDSLTVGESSPDRPRTAAFVSTLWPRIPGAVATEHYKRLCGLSNAELGEAVTD